MKTKKIRANKKPAAGRDIALRCPPHPAPREQHDAILGIYLANQTFMMAT